MKLSINIFLFSFLFISFNSSCLNNSRDTITIERYYYDSQDVYKVVIYENGQVEYTGYDFNNQRFTDKIEYNIAKEDVKYLKKNALKINYFSFQDDYFEKFIEKYTDPNDSNTEIIITETETHSQTTITSFNIDGRFKRVVNTYGGPAELNKLEDTIVRIAQIKKFQKDMLN